MKAIVSVIGQDQIGICASVCSCMAAHRINILDISQTIVEGSFTMIMAVDLAACTAPFGDICDELRELGKGMGLSIRMQRQEIFDAMYTV